MTRVVGVVVNYLAEESLDRCLDSLADQGLSEVVVVDNNGPAGPSPRDVRSLVESHPGCRYLKAVGNLGYGAGVNYGLAAAAAGAEAVLVFNPDVVFSPGSVSALRQALYSDARIAIAAPAVLNRDGTLYPSARQFPSLATSVGHGFAGLVKPDNRFSRRYKLADWDHSSRRYVDWVSGSCFMVRAEVMLELAGFDEAYFMYAEDVDLCWRAGKAGYKICYEPAATVVHWRGVSAESRPYRMILAHHVSLGRFAWRQSQDGGRGWLPLIFAGLTARFLASAAQRLDADLRRRFPPRAQGG